MQQRPQHPLCRRFTLFLLGCMPVRLALVVVVLAAPLSWLRWFAPLAAAVATGFWALFILGWRKTGVETGGLPIWWNVLRPVHGTLWGVAAVSAWHADRARAWRVLLADACLGLGSFAAHHGLRS